MKTGNRRRCSWAADSLLKEYHDKEYGNIKSTDNALFEQLCISIFCSGRASRSLMEKRNALSEAFFSYDIKRCASLRSPSIKKIARECGISPAKAQAAKTNAYCCLEVIAEYGSLFKFVYYFKQPERLLPALKRYGFVQVGMATVRAFMRGIGAIEAHDSDCYMFTSKAEA